MKKLSIIFNIVKIVTLNVNNALLLILVLNVQILNINHLYVSKKQHMLVFLLQLNKIIFKLLNFVNCNAKTVKVIQTIVHYVELVKIELSKYQIVCVNLVFMMIIILKLIVFSAKNNAKNGNNN